MTKQMIKRLTAMLLIITLLAMDLKIPVYAVTDAVSDPTAMNESVRMDSESDIPARIVVDRLKAIPAGYFC